MTGSGVQRVAAAFIDLASADRLPCRCSVSAELLSVTSAGVTLMSGSHSGPVCSSSDRATELESSQFTLGEGPFRDAFRSGELGVSVREALLRLRAHAFATDRRSERRDESPHPGVGEEIDEKRTGGRAHVRRTGGFARRVLRSGRPAHGAE